MSDPIPPPPPTPPPNPESHTEGRCDFCKDYEAPIFWINRDGSMGFVETPSTWFAAWEASLKPMINQFSNVWNMFMAPYHYWQIWQQSDAWDQYQKMFGGKK